MKIVPIKTKIVTNKDGDLIQFVDEHISSLKEKSIIAITSKVVAIMEKRIVNNTSIEKDKLVIEEADYYLPKIKKYNLRLTIKDNVLIPAAGIDESNAFGNFILWPEDSYKSARKIRNFLAKKFRLKNLGVVITDSKTMPLRWGTTGISIGYSGFEALNNYIGKKDLFGRELKYTMANVADGLAAAAVLAMGEGKEQNPIVICEDLENINFNSNSPSLLQRKQFNISPKDDLYYPILSSVRWRSQKKTTKAERFSDKRQGI